MLECPGPATVVFDKALTEYNFGPEHPMSPIRVDLTMRLAEHLPQADVAMTLVKDGDHRLSRPQDLALMLRLVEGMVGK